MSVKLMSNFLIDGKVILENVKAVIFDKDGTLIDIHHYWSSMIKQRSSLVAIKWFNNNDKETIENYLVSLMGFDIQTGKMKPEGPIGIKPRSFIVNIVADFVRQSGFSITNDEVEILFNKVDKETSQDMLPLLKVLPSVNELLLKLNECGIQSVIASTDITSRAEIAMKTLKLDKYFSNIVGSDLVDKSKPAPDLANLALNDMAFDANSVVVIGDHPYDIQMGENINSGLNIAVLTGISNYSMFSGLNCIVTNDLSSIQIN
jgi:phosphoglycolate phosphatase